MTPSKTAFVRVLLPAVGVAAVLFAGPACAEIVIDSVTFHQASRITSGGPQNESGYPDNGGAVFIVVKNAGATTEVLDPYATQVNGTNIDSLANIKWARAWPLSIGPGAASVITVKSIGAPLTQNAAAVRLEVRTRGGATATATPTLVSPDLRLGHVAASPDRRTLWIFLRNLDATRSFTINDVRLNAASITNACAFVGGSRVVDANSVAIVQWTRSPAFGLMENLAVSVSATRSDGQAVEAGAAVRVTDPNLPVGTYGGSLLAGDSYATDCRRSFGLEIAWPDPAQPTPGRRIASSYFVGALILPGFTDPATVIRMRDDPRTFGYVQSDEPDLDNAADDGGVETSRLLADQAMMIRTNDAIHPTMVNMAANKRFQEFGLMSDHPCLDHYCQFAPLVYGIDYLTTYSIKEAAWYTRSLKLNCEPLAIWATPEAVLWKAAVQPTDWGIKVQFWSHVAFGSKGLTFWVAEPECTVLQPVLHAVIQQVVTELKMVEGIAYYGDSLENVTCSHPDLLAASLTSARAMLVVVVNGSGTYNKLRGVRMTDRTGQSLQFKVPAWIPLERIREVRATGLVTPASTVAGRTVTITGVDLPATAPHRVYLVGANDTTPPQPPAGLNLAWAQSATTNWLSWREPPDDVGVWGYQVYRDAVLVDDVRTPIANIGTALAPGSVVQVRAYDAAGNLSAPGVYPAAGGPAAVRQGNR